MNLNPKISVIIPVYNPGESLHNCVKSLLAQTIEDIELIFVLDCPTDGSDKIIEEYAIGNSQIKFVRNEKNLNIGKSRNVGLSIAKGDYVAFCDHDDIVQPFMYKNMVDLAEKENADIVLGVPEYVYDNPNLNKIYFYPDFIGDIRLKLLSLIIGVDNDEKQWEFYFSHGVIWDKIYKRSFLQDYEIKFVDNNIITFEDNLFNIETLVAAKNVSVYNHLVYHHIIIGLNTAATYGYSKYDRVNGYISYLYDKLSEKGLFEEYKVRFSNSVVMYVTGSFVVEIKNNWKKPQRILECVSYLKGNKIIRNAFRFSKIKPSSNRFMRNAVLMCINLLFKI